MGCNTSKESIQQAVEEAKEEVKETAKDIARDLLKEEKKEEAKNGDVPKSAETATAGDSPAKQPAAEAPSEEESKSVANEAAGESTARSKEDEKEEEADDKVKEEEAATRIQAAFRGHHARKSLKETDSQASVNEAGPLEPTKEQLEQEFRKDDKELCSAATKIQANFRGHMSRKVDQAATAAKELVENAAEKIDEKVTDAVNELEGIDLSDPDLHKAATKIQASFRGHKVRQEVTVPGTEEKK